MSCSTKKNLGFLGEMADSSSVGIIQNGLEEHLIPIT
jgi:hypothetical protein